MNSKILLMTSALLLIGYITTGMPQTFIQQKRLRNNYYKYLLFYTLKNKINMRNLINLLVVIELFCMGGCGNKGNEMNITVKLSDVEPFMEAAINKTDPDFTKVMDKVMTEKQQYPDSSVVDLFYYYCQKQDPKTPMSQFFSSYELSNYADYQNNDGGPRTISNEALRKGLKDYIANAWRSTYLAISSRMYYLGNGDIYIKQDKNKELYEAASYCFPTNQKTLNLYKVEHPERIRKLLSTKGSFEVYEVNQGAGSSITMNDLKSERDGKGLFDNKSIESAREIKDGGNIKIEIKFKNSSEMILCRFTSENIGKKIAIVIDHKIFATLVINEIIEDGKLIIPTPNLTKDQIEDLIIMLKSGCLQTSVKIANEQIVKK